MIPMRYGQALTVNLSSGALIPQSIVDPPEKSMDQYGAIASDDELICVSTPACVAVFPRVDALLRNAEQLPALTANPTKRFLIQAQAHLINGDSATSLALLKEAVASRNADTPPVPQIDEFLAALMLQQWGRAIAAERESMRVPHQEQFTLPSAGIPRDAALLSELKLPAHLEFRTSVFQLLSESLPDRRELGLKPLKQNRDWNKPIRLTDMWSVRPELLFHEPSIDLTGDRIEFDKLSNQELRQLVGHTLQHPEMLPDDASRQTLATRLINRGEFAEAELFLIRWCEAAVSSGNDSSGQALDLLQQMRSLRDTDLLQSQSVSAVDHHESSSRITRNSESPKYGLTSTVSGPLSFELSPFIRQPDADFESLDRHVWSDALPQHSRMNTYLSGETDVSGKLISIDPLDGSTRDQVVLPFAINSTAGRFVPLSDGDLTPGMFPVCSTDEIAMMSCPIPGEAGILWTRRFRQGEKNAHRVEFGPLGSDHFIWQFADELHCSDPLTGNDLWTRKRTLSHSEQMMLDRGINPSVAQNRG